MVGKLVLRARGRGASQAQGRGPLWQEMVEGVGFWRVPRASLEGSSSALAQRNLRVVRVGAEKTEWLEVPVPAG